MIKAVILDLNGVVVLGEYTSKRFERDYGVPYEEFFKVLKEILKVVNKPGAPSIFSLFTPHLNYWEVDLSEEEFLNYWLSGEDINKELLELLDKIKDQGIKVFSLSNNFRERTVYYREHFPEMFETFDKSYFSWETGFPKPDKKAFLNVLAENDLKPEECLFFDDAEKNVKVAKELGLKAELYQDVEQVKVMLSL